jgi:hypothetical protein
LGATCAGAQNGGSDADALVLCEAARIGLRGAFEEDGEALAVLGDTGGVLDADAQSARVLTAANSK